MNNRDYRRSTPYSTDELADFTSVDTEVQASAVRRWGTEIAQFLAYLCSTLHIPNTVTERGKKVGGLTLITWSLSGMAALSLLGDPRTMGEKLTSTIAPYLRKVILYGAYNMFMNVENFEAYEDRPSMHSLRRGARHRSKLPLSGP